MYCTVARMVELFGEPEMEHLSQLYDPTATTIATVRVDAAIAYAQDEINSYLGGRYTLPLASVPMVLTGKAADIARYQLDSIHPREDVRRRYEDAVRWLVMVASGRLDLGLAVDSTGLPVEVGSDSYSVGFLTSDLTFDVGGY